MSVEPNHEHDLRQLLGALTAGELNVEDALRKLRLLEIARLDEFARLDMNRDLRKGVPEVIYAPHKSDRDLEAIVRRFLVERGLALVSRLDPGRADTLRRALEGSERSDTGNRAGTGALSVSASWDFGMPLDAPPLEGLSFDYDARACVLSARTRSYRAPEERGCVGILTAGTSDIPVAEEAALIVTHMGCRVERGYDTGVAGVHRLLEPLSRMIESGADVLIVVAGMEGALPSVVAGLVDTPVIGVPTSTGYGVGGEGVAALYSILQSCTPGLLAVNIDNGVGAGAAAAMIARRRRE